MDRYPRALKGLVRNDLDYLLAHPVTLALVVVGLAGLVIGLRRRDDYTTLARAALVCAAPYVLLLPNYTAMRLELVFVPPLAIGLGCALAAASSRLRGRGAAPEIVNSS